MTEITGAAVPDDRASYHGRARPPGLPDDLFERGDVPMTKSEVRALTMARAWLRPSDRVLDVGAGSGSLTVEAALLCPQGEVTALERSPKAVALIRKNLARFGLREGVGTGAVHVVAGEAPAAFGDLGTFDCVLLGGSGGRLAAILEQLPRILRPGGRLVANTICLETTTELADALRRPPWRDFDCVHVCVARAVPAGPRLRFEALNPVWVSAATLGVRQAAPQAAAADGMTTDVADTPSGHPDTSGGHLVGTPDGHAEPGLSPAGREDL